MKTKERSDIVVSGNLGGEEIELTLDETSLPHLMGMYIRMYQDPEMATLREIATNARDAHIAAGKSKVPIEITLPTKLHPVLQIEDWGVGLDEDDFRNIYIEDAGDPCAKQRVIVDQQNVHGCRILTLCR